MNENALTQDMILWAMIIARLSGLFVSAPLLQMHYLPTLWKALLVGIFSMIIMPTLPVPEMKAQWATLPAFSLALHLAMELAVGCMLGSLLGISLGIALGAGNLIDSMLGFSNATLLDPTNGEQHPLMSSFYQALMTLVIIGLDGHQALFMLIARSFQWIPVGEATHLHELTALCNSVAGLFFPMMLSLVLPLLMALLGIEIMLAFLSKLMPQVNIMMAAASLKLGLGWLLVWWSMPSTLKAMDNLFWTILGKVGG